MNKKSEMKDQKERQLLEMSDSDDYHTIDDDFKHMLIRQKVPEKPAGMPMWMKKCRPPADVDLAGHGFSLNQFGTTPKASSFDLNKITGTTADDPVIKQYTQKKKKKSQIFFQPHFIIINQNNNNHF